VEEIAYSELPKLMEQESWVMLHLSSGGITHPRFAALKEQFRGVFTYYESDCSSEECAAWIKTNVGLEGFPRLLVYPFLRKTLHLPQVVDPVDTVDVLSESLLEDVKWEKVYPRYDERQLGLDMKQAVSENRYIVFWAFDSEDHYRNLIAATVSAMPKYAKHLR
jgi:hypothetical protein